eukprot:4601812-Prymnesium_polylepis.1
MSCRALRLSALQRISSTARPRCASCKLGAAPCPSTGHVAVPTGAQQHKASARCVRYPEAVLRGVCGTLMRQLEVTSHPEDERHVRHARPRPVLPRPPRAEERPHATPLAQLATCRTVERQAEHRGRHWVRHDPKHVGARHGSGVPWAAVRRPIEHGLCEVKIGSREDKA